MLQGNFEKLYRLFAENSYIWSFRFTFPAICFHLRFFKSQSSLHNILANLVDLTWVTYFRVKKKRLKCHTGWRFPEEWHQRIFFRLCFVLFSNVSRQRFLRSVLSRLRIFSKTDIHDSVKIDICILKNVWYLTLLKEVNWRDRILCVVEVMLLNHG